MRLTVAEAETLNYYMAGLGFVEIAQMQNVNNTTVWRRRNSRGLLNFLPQNPQNHLTFPSFSCKI